MQAAQVGTRLNDVYEYARRSRASFAVWAFHVLNLRRISVDGCKTYTTARSPNGVITVIFLLFESVPPSISRINIAAIIRDYCCCKQRKKKKKNVFRKYATVDRARIALK